MPVSLLSAGRSLFLVAGLMLAAAVDAEAPGWSGCDFGDIRIEADFPGARADACYRQSPDHVAVLVMPEQAGVNPSPWYAFRVFARKRLRLATTLVYGENKHRYWPKLSRDGENWLRLPAGRVEVAADGSKATFELDVGPEAVWIAGQELWPSVRHQEWLERQAQRQGAVVSQLGWSAQRRPIGMLRTDPDEVRGRTVVLVGRQHPPEVPGAFALSSFAETMLDDSELSRQFRATHRVVVVPELNPDGVEMGHWRQNAGGVDINRDWGPFTQPETRLMRELLAGIDRDPATRLVAFVDFHATREDVFYTQRDEDPMRPAVFYQRWLTRLQERMPGYAVNRKAGYQGGYPTAKTWVYETYGVPACTFEIGDETPRDLVASLGAEAARAMMETLLDEAQPAASTTLAAGDGSFRFDGWSGPPIRVWYHLPEAAGRDTPVVFVMHGVGRDADRYRNEWSPLARERNFILVVPEFDKAHFPGAEGYNLGFVRDASGQPVPRDRWSFAAIEPLFEAVRAMTGTRVAHYELYGHSAGAQFVHRYVMFMPAPRLGGAIAANAGWYTMPDAATAYPYGLEGSALTEADLRQALQRPLTILLGTADTDPAHPSLRRTPEAMAQGAHRMARGERFFEKAAVAARDMHVPFGWQLRRAEGVGHDNGAMAAHAAALLVLQESEPGTSE